MWVSVYFETQIIHCVFIIHKVLKSISTFRWLYYLISLKNWKNVFTIEILWFYLFIRITGTLFDFLRQMLRLHFHLHCLLCHIKSVINLHHLSPCIFVFLVVILYRTCMGQNLGSEATKSISIKSSFVIIEHDFFLVWWSLYFLYYLLFAAAASSDYCPLLIKGNYKSKL